MGAEEAARFENVVFGGTASKNCSQFSPAFGKATPTMTWRGAAGAPRPVSRQFHLPHARMKTSRGLALLIVLQVVIALLVFSRFFSGQVHFAYLDIGSDSFGQVLPDAMHTARSLLREGFTGWSFEFGLGGPTAMLLGDPFSLLGMLGGPDKVLGLRIWVYVLKLMLGGMAFYLLAHCFARRRETAVIVALAYTFCGFVVVNGQWDLEATEFVFFPLILWAVWRTVNTPSLLALPLVVAAALASSVFFVSVGVFLAFTGFALVVMSEQPRHMLKIWLVKLAPLIALGYLLSAPRLLPLALQILDSSRVSGGDSLFQSVVTQSLRLNDWQAIAAQLGALFHKDIFGIGSAYKGYWNYLEGPEFFVGVALLLLLPQLWAGGARDRKMLLAGLAAVAAYVLFPFFRNAAMGFAVPYFRVSVLWVSMLLLLLALRAVDQVLQRGIDRKLLLIGVFAYLIVLAIAVKGAPAGSVAMLHVVKILALLLAGVAVLWLAQRHMPAQLPYALLLLVAVESVVIARPSFVEGRGLVTPEIGARAYDDGTLQALAAIRAADAGVFRIEKTYDSVSLADSLAQDYMGIKSYFMHSRGVVDFHIGAGLIPASSEGNVNYTNWVPNAGTRFVLNSLLGVKYMISREPLQWPGFVEGPAVPGLHIYRNELALPLGIVQPRQVTRSQLQTLKSLPREDAQLMVDVTLINAAIVDQIHPGFGTGFDVEALRQSRQLSLQERYLQPAQALQASGLRIDRFASNHVAGTIRPTEAGILVFSIPFSSGWALKIDGQPVSLFRANFGMLAAQVTPGEHRVELDFRLPGQTVGLGMGAAALGVLAVLVLVTHRRKGSRPNSALSADQA